MGCSSTPPPARSEPAVPLLATSAFPPLLRSIGRYIAPVYDYVLVTEPLSSGEREAIGWRRRQGIADGGNQFHYYRLTRDDRILWGDSTPCTGSEARSARTSTTTMRASPGWPSTSLTTFPQLEGIRFTHRWGGAIDTCSRFSVFFGTAHRGRVVLRGRVHRDWGSAPHGSAPA